VSSNLWTSFLEVRRQSRLRSTKWRKCQVRTACKRKTPSASDETSKENDSTYFLRTCKHMRLCQPQINPARKCQVRTSCERTHTQDSVSSSTQQGKSSTYNLRTQGSVSLRSTQQGKWQARTFCECAETHETQSAAQPSKESQAHTIGIRGPSMIEPVKRHVQIGTVYK